MTGHGAQMVQAGKLTWYSLRAELIGGWEEGQTGMIERTSQVVQRLLVEGGVHSQGN